MKNSERGKIIVETFEQIKSKFAGCSNHRLDMSEADLLATDKISGKILEMYRDLDGMEDCGTCGCVGAYLALFFKKSNGEGLYNFTDGGDALGEKLGFEEEHHPHHLYPSEVLLRWMRSTKKWHNCYVKSIFSERDIAYTRGRKSTLEDVCNCWIVFGHKLIDGRGEVMRAILNAHPATLRALWRKDVNGHGIPVRHLSNNDSVSF